MTRLLAAAAAQVVAFEIDRDLAPAAARSRRFERDDRRRRLPGCDRSTGPRGARRRRRFTRCVGSGGRQPALQRRLADPVQAARAHRERAAASPTPWSCCSARSRIACGAARARRSTACSSVLIGHRRRRRAAAGSSARRLPPPAEGAVGCRQPAIPSAQPAGQGAGGLRRSRPRRSSRGGARPWRTRFARTGPRASPPRCAEPAWMAAGGPKPSTSPELVALSDAIESSTVAVRCRARRSCDRPAEPAIAVSCAIVWRLSDCRVRL